MLDKGVSFCLKLIDLSLSLKINSLGTVIENLFYHRQADEKMDISYRLSCYMPAGLCLMGLMDLPLVT